MCGLAGCLSSNSEGEKRRYKQEKRRNKQKKEDTNRKRRRNKDRDKYATKKKEVDLNNCTIKMSKNTHTEKGVRRRSRR